MPKGDNPCPRYLHRIAVRVKKKSERQCFLDYEKHYTDIKDCSETGKYWKIVCDFCHGTSESSCQGSRIIIKSEDFEDVQCLPNITYLK